MRKARWRWLEIKPIIPAFEAEALGRKAKAYQADVADYAAVESMVKQAREELGRVGHLQVGEGAQHLEILGTPAQTLFKTSGGPGCEELLNDAEYFEPFTSSREVARFIFLDLSPDQIKRLD